MSSNVSHDSAADLTTFGRLYGYVRSFHPSDEVARADWSLLAISGVRDVLGRTRDLRHVLEDWLAPLAPSARIVASSEADPEPASALVAGADLPQVAWQHLGAELDLGFWPYKSGRTNRTRTRPEGEIAALKVWVDVAPTEAERIVFTTDTLAGGAARLRLRIRAFSGRKRIDEAEDIFELAVDERSISSVTLGVSTIAERLEATFELLDAVTLNVFDAHIAIEGSDGEDLERLRDYQGKYFDPYEGAWVSEGTAYDFELTDADEDAFARWKPWSDPPFFEAVPKPLETIRVDLGRGLDLLLPLSLGTEDNHTVPAATTPARAAPSDVEDHEKHLASVIVAWNILQHFYPYFDGLDVDWSEVLHDTLVGVLRATGRDEMRAVQESMLVPLCDGHAGFHWHIGSVGLLPIFLKRIESELILAASRDEIGIPVGARVVTFDGADAETVFRQIYSQRSGTDRYRRIRSCKELVAGKRRETVDLEWEFGGISGQTTLTYEHTDYPEFRNYDVVTELAPGTWYVNGLKIDLDSLDAHADRLAAAATIIVDFRGYPSRHALELLGHFIEEPVDCGLWNVPQIIYPDQERLAGYSDDGRWKVEPRQPHFSARRYFMTGPGAISYGETVMEIVEHHELGTIVGEPTAGTNGNVNKVRLPDGSNFVFTGMLVLKQDGSPLHRIGVEPHHLVRETREGIAAGNDEVLEATLRLAENRGE